MLPYYLSSKRVSVVRAVSEGLSTQPSPRSPLGLPARFITMN